MKQPRSVGRRKAEQRAADLLAKCGVSAPPVPVDDLAAQLEIEIFEDRLPADTSAVLIRQPNGERIIAVNKAHHRLRRRFSVAHELGHALLHFPDTAPSGYAVVDRPLEVLFRDNLASQGTSDVEIDANSFAAALLMPSDAVKDYYRDALNAGKRRTALAGTLAEVFDVSAQAMGFRLVNLGLLDPT